MGRHRQAPRQIRRNVSFLAFLESRMMTSGASYSVLFAFVAANAILFWYGFLLERREHDNFKKWTTVIARGTGYMLNFDTGLLLLLGSKVFLGALRSTPLNLLIPFDQAMPKAHIAVGYTCFVAALFHGCFHFTPGLIANSWQRGFLGWTYEVITGFVILSVFIVLVIFARKSVRKEKFEIFYYVHLVAAVLFFGILFFHGLLFGKLYTWKWILLPVLVYIADRGYRMATERRGSIDLCSPNVAFLSGDILRLEIPRDFKFRPGQWAELCIPHLSAFQYHPFTIASSPHSDSLTFFIKSRGRGSWTAHLQNLVRESQKTHADMKTNMVGFRLRGPYGAPAQHVGQYEKVLLVSAGVGGTPFLSQIISFIAGVESSRIKASIAATSSATRDPSSSRVKGCIDATVSSMTDPSSSQGSCSTDQEWSSASSFSNAQNHLSDIGQALPSLGSAGFWQSQMPSSHPMKVGESSKLPSVSGLPPGGPEVANRSETLLEKAHFVLSSTTIAFMLLYFSMMRFFIFLVVSVHSSVPGSKSDALVGSLVGFLGFDSLPMGFRIADFVCASIVFLTTLVTIALDNSLKAGETALFRQVIDIFFVIPVLAAPLVLHGIVHVQDNRFSDQVPPAVYYATWILTVAVIIYRHIRAGRPHTILADSTCSKYRNTQSLDFVYTTPTARDDRWLIDELGALTNSPHFRLHRFLTREKPDEEAPDQHIVGRFETNYGRPDWDELMTTLVDNSESGSSIGVFFCGPEVMELDLRRAAFNAMERSRQRSWGGKHAAEGANIRLVVRAENF